MMEDWPSNLGEGPGMDPSAGQWAPPYPVAPAARCRMWPALATAAIASLLAVAALIVALVRPAASTSSATSTSSSYSVAEVAAAHQKLCDAYKLAARAVQIETHGTSPERAGIAEVNGAMILKEAVNGYPAITPNDRATAVELADAYNNIAAVASLSDNSAWQTALDDTNAKDAAMKKVCNG